MIAQPVSIDNGNSIGDSISWGAGQDSFYEVFPRSSKVDCSILLKRLFCGQIQRQNCIEIDGY
jgi:hypothetical protein